ncbi:MAG: glycerophosphodiester phosphodiesterase [Candidatus Hydrogenedentes bacterium]|jgi:glycerophosphoryl diester phosphodiesterase|nr:glycerophosphodiester phosphodiesterase [Candidatus Hydrogenedentota bacterium]
MKMHPCLSLLLVGLMALCLVQAATAEKIVIAHRGASGYLPEHTLPAYAMAYAMGADFIEQDLAMTSDHVLICLHDSTLDKITNVAEVFPDRHREDGKYYPADFTLAEIKQLRVHERLPVRFPPQHSIFSLVTFEEAIQLIQGLNKSTKKNVGIYPELKDPNFYKDLDFPFEKTVLDILAKYGYEGPSANIYIQSFSPAALKRLREEFKTTLPLMQLISDNDMLEELGIEHIAGYAQAIGPDKKCIVKDPSLVKRAHDAGLKVHPYTFRTEVTLDGYKDIETEMRAFLFEFDIDGGFSDYPDLMRAVIDEAKN